MEWDSRSFKSSIATSQSGKYEECGVDEEDSFLNQDQGQQNTGKSHTLPAFEHWRVCLLILSVLCVTTVALFASMKILSLPSPPPDWRSCGSTKEEAVANGCHYVPMQHGWVPDACYYPSLVYEFDPFSEQEWYLNNDLTVLADMDKLRAGESFTAYTQSFVEHECMYNWRKLAMAVAERRKLIDSWSYDEPTTSFCARQIAEKRLLIGNGTYEAGTYFTEVGLAFLECRRLPWSTV
jgi:hypothetical protein